MRRIDLGCKLIGPLFIAFIETVSTETAILANLGMNICSVVVEYFSIARVWFFQHIHTCLAFSAYIEDPSHSVLQVYYEVPELQGPKRLASSNPPSAGLQQQTRPVYFWKRSHDIIQKGLREFGLYFHHRMFLPSFAGALLYLTVLSFSGQMVTWLLSTGYDSTQIAIARTLSVAFEVLATWVAPWLMERIGTTRAGLWLVSWQIACLAAGISFFWKFSGDSLVSASGLVGGTILSRAGLRGFDLCVQILVQEVSCFFFSRNTILFVL